MKYPGVPEPATQTIPNFQNLFKSLFFISMIGIGFSFAELSATYFDAQIEQTSHGSLLVAGKWGVIMAIAVFNCIFLVAIGVLAHDAVHKVLFKNNFLNEFAGGLLSGFSLLPFCTNRQFHLTHHSFAHQPGKDPENKFHDKPYLIALVFGALFALSEQYSLLFENTINRFSDSRFRTRVIRDIVTTSFVLLVYFYLLPKAGLHLGYTVFPLLAMLPAVFSYRAISDHFGLPAVIREGIDGLDVDQDNMDQWHKSNKKMQHDITGWVILTNPLVEWVWSNVNYHEVHHKFPYLSYKHLPVAFHATEKILPYAVKKGYTASLFSLRKSKYYSQYDEVKEFLTIPDN